MMKRKVILGSSAVLVFAILVSIIYATFVNSRISSAPAQAPQNSVRSTVNMSPNDLGKTSTASEKKPSAGVTIPQQVEASSMNALPTPSQTGSTAPPIKGKFSGTWVLDPAKSKGLEPGMNQVMVVTQAGNIMTVKTTVSTPTRAAWTVTDIYTLNGQETEFVAQSNVGATVKGQRIARLTNDGNSIEVTERAVMEGRGASAKVNTTRRWMLDGDKSLVIEMNIEGSNANLHHKRVFVRQ
jgi:hypothetical protein